MKFLLNPEVILAASKSTLGIFSLMILVLTLVALIFFHKAPVWTRLIVFILMMCGVASYGYSIQREGAKKIQDDKVAACVAKKTDQYLVVKNDSTQGGARASSPGWHVGKNIANEEVCFVVGITREIIGASTTNLSCHGGRCSVTAPVISDERKKVCVITTAWSGSGAGDGGGSAQYRLDVSYREIVTESILENFRSVCIGEINI